MLCTKNIIFFHFFHIFFGVVFHFDLKNRPNPMDGMLRYRQYYLDECQIRWNIYCSTKKSWKFLIFTKIFIFRAQQILSSYYIPNLIKICLNWRYEKNSTKNSTNATSCDMVLNTIRSHSTWKQSNISKFSRFFDFATVFARS